MSDICLMLVKISSNSQKIKTPSPWETACFCHQLRVNNKPAFDDLMPIFQHPGGHSSKE